MPASQPKGYCCSKAGRQAGAASCAAICAACPAGHNHACSRLPWASPPPPQTQNNNNHSLSRQQSFVAATVDGWPPLLTHPAAAVLIRLAMIIIRCAALPSRPLVAASPQQQALALGTPRSGGGATDSNPVSARQLGPESSSGYEEGGAGGARAAGQGSLLEGLAAEGSALLRRLQQPQQPQAAVPATPGMGEQRFGWCACAVREDGRAGWCKPQAGTG